MSKINQFSLLQKWAFFCLFSSALLLIIVTSFNKSVYSWSLSLFGMFLIWLSVPALGENVSDIFRSPSDFWQNFWRINGVTGIRNCLGLIAVGLILITLSFVL